MLVTCVIEFPIAKGKAGVLNFVGVPSRPGVSPPNPTFSFPFPFPKANLYSPSLKGAGLLIFGVSGILKVGFTFEAGTFGTLLSLNVGVLVDGLKAKDGVWSTFGRFGGGSSVGIIKAT